MVQTEEDREHRRSHHRDQQREPGPVRRFLQRFRFEFIWVTIMLLGAFLLLEQMDVRHRILAWVRAALSALGRGLESLEHLVGDIIGQITLSDAVGFVLIFVAVGAIGWRARWRLLHTPSLTLPRCPVCKGAVHRVRRTPADRILSRFVPVHRFRCASHDCGWEGLRVNDGTHRQQHRSTADPSF